MKEKIKALARRYRVFLILLVPYAVLLLALPEIGKRAVQSTGASLFEMLCVIPPIFILLGLLDVWIKRETMVKYMGEKSGRVGILLGFLMGSVAAGPLYAAFPLAGVLLRKGSSLMNVLIMLGAWSTTKIPLLLFEASAMGIKFTLLRLALNLVGIAAIAFLTQKILTPRDREAIYRNAAERGA